MMLPIANETPLPPPGIPSPHPGGLVLRAMRAVGAACLGLALGSCGGNVTAGGFGEVQVTVSGDAPTSHTVSLAGAGRAGSAPGDSPVVAFDHEDDDPPEGKLEIEFLLYLLRADGSAVEVSDKEIEVELDLAGFVERDVVHALVPAERYVGIRILFTELEVEVDRGVIIDGVVITGPIEVELEDDEIIEVERAVDLHVLEGGVVEVLLDMNARIWLAAIDPDLRRVAERVVAEAIRVEVRP
jgi:hypothetical protein